MDDPHSLPAKRGHPQNSQVRLVQRGRGTFTSSRIREGLWETRISNWGQVRNLGEFDSVEAALAAAGEALEKDPKGMFLVVDHKEIVLAEKLDAKLHQKLEARADRLIKTVFFLVCAMVMGAAFHDYDTASTWDALAIWVTGFYLLLWLFGLMSNWVESCVIAVILTTIACLLFPTLDLISKAKARAYLKREQSEREAQTRHPVTP